MVRDLGLWKPCSVPTSSRPARSNSSDACNLLCFRKECEDGQLRALNWRERVKPKNVMLAHTHSWRNWLRCGVKDVPDCGCRAACFGLRFGRSPPPHRSPGKPCNRTSPKDDRRVCLRIASAAGRRPPPGDWAKFPQFQFRIVQ